jgi:hypothetical protein
MKQVIIIAFFMTSIIPVFSQKSTDPSYSASNYKHPNKAAYARKHNLDNATMLETVSVTDNSNYKQPFNSGKRTTKAKVYATKTDKRKRNASYKHPFGL